MEKCFERHVVNQRSNCCFLKTKPPCSISLMGVEVVKDSTKNTSMISLNGDHLAVRGNVANMWLALFRKRI